MTDPDTKPDLVIRVSLDLLAGSTLETGSVTYVVLHSKYDRDGMWRVELEATHIHACTIDGKRV